MQIEEWNVYCFGKFSVVFVFQLWVLGKSKISDNNNFRTSGNVWSITCQVCVFTAYLVACFSQFEMIENCEIGQFFF